MKREEVSYECDARLILFHMFYICMLNVSVFVFRSLRSLLDGEMEHSASLRQETDLLKKKLTEMEERHGAKVQALARYCRIHP